MKLFSVVIPLFNKSHTIVDTVSSVLAQDYPDFEVIIVNDGSTDGSPEKVLSRFTDSRIRIVDQEHRGASAARNRGVAAAEGEYIAFLDGDDLFLPGYLSAMNSLAEQFPDAGMLCCAGVDLFPDGSGYERYSRRFRGSNYPIDFFGNPWFFSATSSTVIRASVFDLAGGFPVGMAHWEEHAFFQSLAQLVSVAYCPAPLAVRRVGMGGHASTSDLDSVYTDYADKTNIVYNVWRSLDRDRRSPRVPEFLISDLRERLLACLRGHDYANTHILTTNTAPGVLARLGRFEVALYTDERLRGFAMGWLYSTKLARRIKRLQRTRFAKSIDPEILSAVSRCLRPEWADGR